MTPGQIFVVGAAHVDRRGRIAGTYVSGASNPGAMREEIGGGAFNALRSAARHGAVTSLMSLRGGDSSGEAVARAIAEAGALDLSAIFLDRTTPSYTALIDCDGDLIAGFADMGLYDIGFERQMRRRVIRDAIGDADAILCDANLPAPALARLGKLAADKPVFAVAVSPAKVVRFAGLLPMLACLFMNRLEAAALAGIGEATPREAAGALRAVGLARGIITAGGGELTGFDEDGLFTIQPPSPSRIADVTGAGDALAGATAACLMRGMGLREAARHGVAAAVLTVESEAVVADYDDEGFAETLALVGLARPVA